MSGGVSPSADEVDRGGRFAPLETPAASGSGPALGRRELLRAGGALALAGAGAGALGWPLATLAAGGDIVRIARLVQLEQAARFAYGELLRRHGRLLAPSLRRLLTLLRAQEAAHARALEGVLVGALGSRPPRTPRSAAAVESLLPGLEGVGSRSALLAYVLKVEDGEVSAQLAALGKLSDARAIQAVGRVLGGEGQHLVLARAAQGSELLPAPLEQGAAAT